MAGLNYNVKLALLWSLVENVSASVRSGDVFSALLYLLTKSNTTVGIVQGINGLMQLLAALPAGFAADRLRRDSVLRAGAAVGAAAGGVLGYALLAPRPSVALLGVAMGLLGCYRGIHSAAMESIFADSIAEGRSGLYSKKYAVTVLASSFGPWLALALFHRLGNRWDAADCRLVLLSGLAIMAAPLAIMCCFDDDKAAPTARRHDGWHAQAQAAAGAAAHSRPATDAAPAGCTDDEAPAASPAAVETPAAQSCQADGQAATAILQQDQCFGAALTWSGSVPAGIVVTLLISTSDFIGAFASGMTIKFFALFFMQRVGLSPSAVSLIGALSPLGVAGAALVCQPLSKYVGRIQISLITRCLDIMLLVALANLPCGPGPAARHLLVAVHLVRMAVANATRPLLRSVLMDFVPRRHRGKVNAVDSVRSFSWSGSAALGGFLIETFGFEHTFIITAAIKTAAFAPLLLLLAYVPDGMCLAGSRAARLAQAAHSASDGELRRPLLDGRGV